MAGKKLSPQERRGTLSRLFSDMGKSKKHFWLALTIVGAAKICLAMAPAAASKITDLLQGFVSTGSLDMQLIFIFCGVLALLYLIGYGADGFVNKLLVLISQKIAVRLRNNVGEKLNRLPLQYLDTHPVGDTQSRVTVDLLNLTNGIESTAPTLIGQFVLMITILLMMFITDYRLALIYIVIIPLTLLGLKLITKWTNKLFMKCNKIQGQINSKVTDTYSNHMVVKSFGRCDEKQAEFDKLNGEFERAFVKSRFLSGFMRPISSLTAKISYILLCLISGVFMIRGELSLGEFTAFLFYGNMIGTPMSELSIAINNFQNALSSATRVYELLDEPEEEQNEVSGSLELDKVKGEVEFENITFGYTPDKCLMKDVSFKAEAGYTMAIVGPSGAGKTTLVNLLLRFYEINGGSIKLDGTDVSKLSKQNLRSAFGMVLQDSWVFDGTIAENIAFGKPDATRDEIVAAAKMVYCDSFIEKLPDGYDTVISESSESLSAGEKQLLSLARAVISNPGILILDEATSKIDTKTEEIITRAMEKMMENRTTFIIAHRLHTIRNADKIIFMVDGDIKEVGSHDELLAKKGLYAEMYASGTSAE